MRSISLCCAAVFSVIALSACGGGSGSSPAPAAGKVAPVQQVAQKKPAEGKPEPTHKPTGPEILPPVKPVTSAMTDTSTPASPNAVTATAVEPSQMASYDSLINETILISERYHIADQTFADRTFDWLVPTSGKAEYKGAGIYRPVALSDEPDAPLIGRAVLTADFGAEKLTGQVTDFKASAHHETTGGLLNVDADIHGADMAGKITGNLNFDGSDIKIDDRALGEFYGYDAQALAVVSSPDISPDADHYIAIIAEQ